MALGCPGPRGALVSLLAALLCAPAASAQAAPETQSPQPLSRAQGEAVVQAAWDLRKAMNPRLDCSHFVHAAYQRAGLDYEYANSIAIFEGVDAFQRVSKPQAGDLIVWPGHVGVIIDPDEHSFYSSVVKGFALEDYHSRYWARHGHPRFYRYLIDEARTARLQARTEVARNSPSDEAPTARPQTRTEVARKTAMVVRKPARAPQVISDQPVLEDKADSSEETSAAESHAADSKPANSFNDGEVEVLDTVFVSTRARPLKSELRALLMSIGEANGDRALRNGVLDSQVVEIADNLAVDEIHIQGSYGSALVTMVTTASIRNGRAEMHKNATHWRLALRHEPQGWVMLVPHDKCRVTRDQAIQALTARVSRLSGDSEHQMELKRSVRMLDDLLAGRTRYVPVTESD